MKKETEKSKAMMAIVTCAFLYSLMGIAIRLMDAAHIPDMYQVTLRLSLSIIPALILFYKDVTLSTLQKIKAKDWIVMFVMGTLGYSIAVYFITRAFIETTFLNASLVYTTVPIFMFIYAVFFRKTKFNIGVLIMTILAIYGVAIISAKSFLPFIDRLGSGEVFAFLAAATFAVFYFGRQLISSEIKNGTITVITIIIAAVCSLIIATITGEKFVLANMLSFNALLGLAIGIFVNVTTTFLSNYGFQRLNAVLGSQLMLAEVFFSFLIGLFLYSEPYNSYIFAGAILILVAVYFTNIWTAKDEKKI